MAQGRYRTHAIQIDGVAVLKLVYDDGALRIQGFNREGSVLVELRFRDVLLTRISPEATRLRLLPELAAERGLVLVDEQSDLISWLLDEGLHTRDMQQAKHFLTLVGEEIVDVVALSDPEVSKCG